MAFPRANLLIKRFTGALIALFIFKLIAVLINLLQLPPVWMQVVHQLLADLVWKTLVLFAAGVFPQTELKLSYVASHELMSLEY